MIGCHAMRIAENRRIEEMDRLSTPLLYTVMLAAVAVIAATLITDYRNDADTASAFIACLNGHVIQMGESVITCPVQQIKLVEGLK